MDDLARSSKAFEPASVDLEGDRPGVSDCQLDRTNEVESERTAASEQTLLLLPVAIPQVYPTFGIVADGDHDGDQVPFGALCGTRHRCTLGR